VSARRTALSLLAALVLSAGLLVGFGTGAATAGRKGTATTGTSATVPEPVVTTVMRTTTAAQILPGTGKPDVHLGYENTPEQSIIGHLYELALEQEGYTVIPDANIGEPDLRIAGLRDGKLDIYPEYLGSWNSRFAHLHHRYQTLQASYAAGARYARKHGFMLLPPTPFSDTNCVAVLAQYAARNHVYSIPQLARRRPIVFGAPRTFQSIADGLPALEHGYDLHPRRVQTVLVDTLQYSWLRGHSGQATYCTTTDPQLDGSRFLQLRDPKHIFGHGNVVPVTTRQVLTQEGEAFAHTIKLVDSLLTLQAMRGLNAEYELGGQDPKAIAEQFLEGNAILPRSRYAPVPTSTSPSGSTSTQS
jgi:glycine betaine/choline ABC-type transport system substrate-binding protein